jgi:hypothetical protein
VNDHLVMAGNHHAGSGKQGRDLPGPVRDSRNFSGAVIGEGTHSTAARKSIPFASVITARCDGCLAHLARADMKAGATGAKHG